MKDRRRVWSDTEKGSGDRPARSPARDHQVRQPCEKAHRWIGSHVRHRRRAPMRSRSRAAGGTPTTTCCRIDAREVRGQAPIRAVPHVATVRGLTTSESEHGDQGPGSGARAREERRSSPRTSRTCASARVLQERVHAGSGHAHGQAVRHLLAASAGDRRPRCRGLRPAAAHTGARRRNTAPVSSRRTWCSSMGMPGSAGPGSPRDFITDSGRSTRRLYAASGGRSTGPRQNPLDDWRGEEVLLLDDLRASAMDANDWLLLLDPYNASPAKARYRTGRGSRLSVSAATIEPVEFFYYAARRATWTQALDQFIRRLAPRS